MTAWLLSTLRATIHLIDCCNITLSPARPNGFVFLYRSFGRAIILLPKGRGMLNLYSSTVVLSKNISI